MKLLKNKTIRIVGVLLFLLLIGVIIFLNNDETAKADDKASVQYVKEEIEKLNNSMQEKINELNVNAEEQKTTIEKQENLIKELQTALDKVNAKVETLEKNNKANETKISSISSKVDKIEIRENYFYSNATSEYKLGSTVRHINQNLR